MNSWTDTLLIIAIVLGLISAASLPLVSVNAISFDSLRLRDSRREAPPWLVTADDATRRRFSAWQEAKALQSANHAAMAAPAPTSAGTPRMSGALGAAASGVGEVVEALPAAIIDPSSSGTPAKH